MTLERAELSLGWIRQRYAAAARRREGVTDDGWARGAFEHATPAAVLVPLVDRPTRPTVLLTRRTAHLHAHAGQISFPGGRSEPQDVDAVATALRDTNEEIGIALDRLEVLGTMPEYYTGTGYCITPVLAIVSTPFELNPDRFEVDEVFEVPLDFLLNQANHQRHSREYQGRLRHYFAMPYGDYFIWGATAGMLVNLYYLLYGNTAANVPLN